MGKVTRIQWCDATWNPWYGCRMVSSGCTNCYMFRDMTRYGKIPTDVQRAKDSTFYAPTRWSKSRVVFTCSWSDFFIEDADGQWRDDAWNVIGKTPQHTYQVLTKRIERVTSIPHNNVWLGTSVEDVKVMSRIDMLKEKDAVIRWLSLEPLLGPLDSLDLDGIDWVVVGGESGNDYGRYKYRTCQLEWIESIISQCRRQDIAVFVKQLGTSLAKKLGLEHRHGGKIEEFPISLQVREYPNSVGTHSEQNSPQMTLF